ncbi:hypothetical protein ACFSKL_12820 [Belliella marina]|uniref:Uncharacterized protein n=1 Tax=Belliella marina TaxID=1644146 RepID=A0ABW4VLW7_9BACT
MSKMETEVQKVLNVTKSGKLILSVLMFLITPLSFVYCQGTNVYHSTLNEILEFNDKGRIDLLKEVDLSTAWVDYLEDTAFLRNTFKHVYAKERVEDLIARIDLVEVRDLIKSTPEFTWERQKLNRAYKLRKKVSEKGLTYKYSIPIVNNDICLLRVTSFDSVNNIGDYIYIMKKKEYNQWTTECVLVIHEMFPDYVL